MSRIAAALLLCRIVLSPLAAQATAAPASVGAMVASAGAQTLKSAAAALGARLSWDPLTLTGYLEREGYRASFKLGFPWWMLEEGSLARFDPVELRGGVPFVTEAAVSALQDWYLKKAEERNSQFHVAAILIDPGHGGKDPGAVADHVLGGKKRRLVEKDIALAVALRIRDRLAEFWPGRKILLTRDSDIYPTLEERVAIANSLDLGKNDAIIYVSIHANASFNKNARGFEVWYLNPDYRRSLVDGQKLPETDAEILPILNAMLEEEFTTESVLLAKRILDRIGASIGDASPNRGLRAEEWFVVRNAKMPSVLVELGFVTNAQDAALLTSGDYLQKLGDGIYTGIVDFVEYFENRKGSALP